MNDQELKDFYDWWNAHGYLPRAMAEDTYKEFTNLTSRIAELEKDNITTKIAFGKFISGHRGDELWNVLDEQSYLQALAGKEKV